MGFPRQEHWSSLPLPSPGDLPDPGFEPGSPVSPALQADSLPAEPSGKPKKTVEFSNYKTIHLSDKIVESVKIPFLIFPNSCLKLSQLAVSLLFQEKAMAPHSSPLAWKIPWTQEPGRL